MPYRIKNSQQVIFEGSSKDCRHIAQEKNLNKGRLKEELANRSDESSSESVSRIIINSNKII